MAARRVYTGTRPPRYLDPVERLRLEQLGDMVPQAAAQTEADRWLALIRSASTPAATSWFRFLGGDVTDQVLTSSGRVHIGSDVVAGSTITNDTYAADILPFRNGAIVEQPAGTFNRQLYAGAATTGTTWVPNQTDHPGRHYWPICAVVDPTNADRLVLGCWLVNSPTATAPYGRLEDVHILSCSLAFGAAVSDTHKFGLAGAGPHILKFWSDATHVYSLWEDFHPDYDPTTPGQPTYGKSGNAAGSDLPYHHSRIKLARATNADLDVLANWRWWNGSTWVADRTQAVYLSDEEGAPVRGDFDVTQVGDGTLRGVGHALTTAASVGGATSRAVGRSRGACAWARFKIHGGLQIGQFARFVEHVAAPAEHSVVCLSLNLLDPTGTAAGRNIRRYAPQFVVVPHYPG